MTKSALSGRVGAEIEAVLLREAQLQRLVLGGERRIVPQRVAEGDSLAPELTPGFGEMEAVLSLRQSVRWLQEVVSDPRSVRCVDVRLLAQRFERRARLLKVAHAGDDVDHRLRRDPGDCRRANVVDPVLAMARAHAPAAHARPQNGVPTRGRRGLRRPIQTQPHAEAKPRSIPGAKTVAERAYSRLSAYSPFIRRGEASATWPMSRRSAGPKYWRTSARSACGGSEDQFA
jgi:hypothetical protein